MPVTEDALAIAPDITRLRHAIHREPEIGLHLPGTQRKVLDFLAGLPLEISTGNALSSVTAVLRGTRADGPVVLLRGDMDALPVTERTGLAYASQTEGTMHACGHDLHTAMLAGAARLLAARQRELPGSVVFMFQPGEEGLAGARYMIEEGVLDAAGRPPAAAYALHVFSAELPTGVISTRPGPMLASSQVLEVTVHGQGGHASIPYRAADPIPAACEMVTALQTMVTRRFDIFDPVVITVGCFQAGTTSNVIPDQATFQATIRTFSPTAWQQVREYALTLVNAIANAHGLTVTAGFRDGYPVTVNDDAEAGFAAGVTAGLLGEASCVAQANPLTGSEDFSFVLEQVPGAFLSLGACPPGTDPHTAPTNHAADAVFDDSVLATGTALYAELALRRLAAGD
jgi:amidohydrolase